MRKCAIWPAASTRCRRARAAPAGSCSSSSSPSSGGSRRSARFPQPRGVHMKAFVCRLLIVLMAWTPYQFAQAGMIGTDQVISTSAQAERGAVLSFVNRADVASQLQSFGIDASTAKDRVAALTDEEVRYL